MHPGERPFDTQELLAHAGWVRALARHLVPGDAHLADDLAQEACLAALQKKPAPDRGDRPLRAWLAGALHNVLRHRRRTQGRVARREELAARPEAQRSTLDHVTALAVHRELVEAVLALDEPYRETIVLRYFDEISPSQIARRQGIPVATVKSRLQRALAELRTRLDREHGGDGRAWIVALLPLSKSTGGVTASTLGVVLVSTNVKIGIGAALLVCGILLFWRTRGEERPRSVTSPETVAAPASAPSPSAHGSSGVLAAGDAPSSERTSLEGHASSASEPKPAPSAPALEHLRGHVLDTRSRALSGVRVQFSPGQRLIAANEFDVPRPKLDERAPSATSDERGGFELDAPPIAGELALDGDERWTTVLSCLCGPGQRTGDHVVVAAPRLVHEGHVVDEQGQPLAGARIEILLPADLRTVFAHDMDNSSARGWVARSDERGDFTFVDAPAVERAELRVSRAGYLAHVEPAPEVSARGLRLVLRRLDARPGTVAGQVVDASGRPVGGARVSLGRNASTVCDAEGAFRIELSKNGGNTPWIALAPGHQPAIEEASPAVAAGQAGAEEFVVLRLGPPPLSIRGRVVDADHEPLAGWRVFAADPTFFAQLDEVPSHVEGLLAGAPGRAEIERLMANAPAGTDPEQLIKQTSTAFWTFVVTDAQGRFALEGLLARTYRLAALDPRTLTRVESEPIHAGRADVEIALPRSAWLDDVKGRVLSAQGKPLAGVLVIPTHDVMKVQLDANSWSGFSIDAANSITDSDGRFSFARLPREGVYLKLGGESIVPLEWGRREAGGLEAAAKGKLDAIVIHAALRYHFQVECAAELGDEIFALDAQGERVPLNVFEGNSSMSTDRKPLVEGRSKVIVVGDEARTLVVFKDGHEVRRVALELAQGTVNVVRL